MISMSEPINTKAKEAKELPFTSPKIITDPKLLKELEKKPLYICPSETEATFDEELIKNDILKKSKEIVGELSHILVAVCPNDPNKDSDTSEKRLDMRIIGGRHRYLQDKNWKRLYLLFNDIMQYWVYRLNFEIRKKNNSVELETQIRMYGQCLYDNGTPPQKIASEICSWIPSLRKQKILKYVPDEWKDPIKVINRKNKTKQKKENSIVQKPTQELENLHSENQKLKQELSDKNAQIQRLQKENSDLHKYIAELERYKR